jgi:hypothetical protein
MYLSGRPLAYMLKALGSIPSPERENSFGTGGIGQVVEPCLAHMRLVSL